MTKERITKAAGTYTMTDILFRQPARLFGPPNQRASEEDIEAVRVGEARLVGCFLKGPCDPYPLQKKQGTLLLRDKRMSWTPYWGKREPLEIDEVPELVERDGNTVRCAMASGQFDFSVPKFDVPLVLDFFQRLLVDK